ncbi:hypothetical protein XENOCAPTIV_013345 [Xenoophorus captivus]|uniref:Uncharacterized protein n=1 Tax=Xenoophorus captivus TaxID=1517983 RepID=A0ABV0R0A6_9TELE
MFQQPVFIKCIQCMQKVDIYIVDSRAKELLKIFLDSAGNEFMGQSLTEEDLFLSFMRLELIRISWLLHSHLFVENSPHVLNGDTIEGVFRTNVQNHILIFYV